MSSYVNTSISLPETFAIISKEQDKEKQVELVRLYDNSTLRWFVDVMYNAPLVGIEVPPYKPSEYSVGNTYTNLASTKRTFEYFLSNQEHPNAKRMLVVSLQNVHKDEAELIVNLLKGNKVEGISKGVWKKAFPEFFPVNDQQTLEDLFED